jgi:hypothetical protein
MPAFVVIQLPSGRRARDLIARRDFKQLCSDHSAKVIEATAGDEPLTPLTLTVPDMACANKLAAALRGQEGVETAYAKPGDELP